MIRTIEAIAAMNMIKLKKLKSNSTYSGPNHASAPFDNVIELSSMELL